MRESKAYKVLTGLLSERISSNLFQTAQLEALIEVSMFIGVLDFCALRIDNSIGWFFIYAKCSAKSVLF